VLVLPVEDRADEQPHPARERRLADVRDAAELPVSLVGPQRHLRDGGEGEEKTELNLDREQRRQFEQARIRGGAHEQLERDRFRRRVEDERDARGELGDRFVGGGGVFE
jgi:hypothetical protein